ncbi:hypothetical protein [Pseudomonas taiwanensis]|uniref:hypothetical protein n=1 Tax=Pseudomonas taiwanensis TaxID=470150 RepID=UPI0004802970|nr:hypothetical protein [Pseudomonas taiwanensis]
MNTKLVNAIREQMRERALAARAGKGYLILFISQSSLKGYSGDQMQRADDALKQMALSEDFQAIGLEIQRRMLRPDSLPSDIVGPDAGLYVRFVWQLVPSASSQLEHVSRSAQACFKQAQVDAVDVTRDLERIFLLVYGD